MQRFIRILLIMLVSFACILSGLTGPTVATAADSSPVDIKVIHSDGCSCKMAPCGYRGSRIIVTVKYPYSLYGGQYWVQVIPPGGTIPEREGPIPSTFSVLPAPPEGEWPKVYQADVYDCVDQVDITCTNNPSDDPLITTIKRNTSWLGVQVPVNVATAGAESPPKEFGIAKPWGDGSPTNPHPSVLSVTSSDSVTRPRWNPDTNSTSDVTLTPGSSGNTNVSVRIQLKPGWPAGWAEIVIDPEGDTYIFYLEFSAGFGPSGVPVFPSVYIGIGAAFGAGVLAYFVRRRIVIQE